MKVLVTGGAGYIGSTVALLLNDLGIDCVILDSLEIGQRDFIKNQVFYHGDIADRVLLRRIFRENQDIISMIHLAARIDVEESVRLPGLYYRENLVKAQILLEEVFQLGIQQVIFSSTAAIYAAGESDKGLVETAEVQPLNPYAQSKLMFEKVLHDMALKAGVRALALRYFNPIGADPQSRSGPYRPDPSHLLGRLTKASNSNTGRFTIFGDDYPTRDGTPIRDFIHVWDLARAHVAALKFLSRQQAPSFHIVNVGSGIGVTVREFVTAFQRVKASSLEVSIGQRRDGDTAGAYADTHLAKELLGWEPLLSLEQGILDALRWEEKWLIQQSTK